MCIYHYFRGAEERSSAVSSAHYRQLVTLSGTFYTLGRLDPAVARVLAVVAPHWDAENPLSLHTRAHLLHAGRVARGAAAAPAAQLLGALRAAEAALGVAEVTAPQFLALRQILRSMGVCE